MPFGRERIARQADAWVARLHGPEGLQDAAGLAAWRKADPRHEAAFQRSESLWQAAGGATRVREAIVSGPGLGQAARGQRRLVFASIAALLLAASGAVLLEGGHRGRIGPTASVSAEAPRALTLSDGTEVELAAGGTITTAFDGRFRRVSLDAGEARFSVAHDTAHPFVVSAGGRTVTARGTVFVVALRPEGLAVTMLEGVVDVSRPPTGLATAPPLKLRGGDRLQITGDDERVVRAGAATARAESTTRDYPPTPLAQLVADADRAAARPIRLGDADLGATIVQGRFDLANTAALAEQLAAALGLGLHEDAQGFVLTRLPERK